MKKRKIISATVILLFITIVVYKWVFYNKEVAGIKQHLSLVQGHVVSHGTDGKGAAGWFYYEFSINGRKYENSVRDHGVTRTAKTIDAFLNRSYSVAYDSTNPRFNEILIFPSDFEKYQLPFPDSLQWVRTYIK